MNCYICIWFSNVAISGKRYLSRYSECLVTFQLEEQRAINPCTDIEQQKQVPPQHALTLLLLYEDVGDDNV